MLTISIILFVYFILGVMLAASIIEVRNVLRVLNEHSLHTDVTIEGMRTRINAIRSLTITLEEQLKTQEQDDK